VSSIDLVALETFAKVHDLTSSDRLPEIELPVKGKLESEFAVEVGAILDQKEAVFLYNNQVIEIQNQELSGELDRNKLASGGLRFSELTAVRAKTFIEDFVKPGVSDNKGKPEGGEFKARSMSETQARGLLESPQFREKLPRINRIIDLPVPILLATGELVAPEPGFNRKLGIYCRPNAPKIRKMDIERARTLIEQALIGFLFKNKQAKVHAVARLITPYARGLIGFTERLPLWFFNANRPRAGKDYLAGIAQIIYLGYAFEDAPLARNSEETSKRIIAALRSGRRMVHFANCQGHIGDAFLIQAITAKTIYGRALGSNSANSDLELPNEIEFSISANIGLTYREDLEPRSRKIDLAFFEEEANGRSFPNPDLHGWVSAHRGELLSAIASLVQYWIDQGMPAGRTPFTSFPRWAEVVGGIMLAGELGDPSLPHEDEDLMSGDLKTSAMRALFQLAYEHYPQAWCTKSQLYGLIKDSQADNDRLVWFGDFDREATKTKMNIGKCLVAFKNREFNNVRLELDQSQANNARWLCRFVPVS
jgi:hypothetical protein